MTTTNSTPTMATPTKITIIRPDNVKTPPKTAQWPAKENYANKAKKYVQNDEKEN